MRIYARRQLLNLSMTLLLVGAISLVFSSITWSDPDTVGCIGPGIADRTIRDCVAATARDVEPGPATLLALVGGTTALAASAIVVLGSTRRVMTIPAAARELNLSPGEVRRLIDEGVLDVGHASPHAIYLETEAVQHLSVKKRRRNSSRSRHSAES